MLDEDAREFAIKHIAAWNSHDLDVVMQAYSDSVTLISPVAASVTGSSTVQGKAALRGYFERGLSAYPDLHFELIETLRCESSITLYFRGVGGRRVAEVLWFDDAGKVERVLAHYSI